MGSKYPYNDTISKKYISISRSKAFLHSEFEYLIRDVIQSLQTYEFCEFTTKIKKHLSKDSAIRVPSELRALSLQDKKTHTQ